jgi:nitrite reductase/ring-hydroxylating ferredoxin subunit
MGADLLEADIEDSGGMQCLRCPWHGKRIDLETGRELTRRTAADGATAALLPRHTGGSVSLCLSDSAMHRVHRVLVPGDGFVYVEVDSGGSCPSDRFNLLFDTVAGGAGSASSQVGAAGTLGGGAASPIAGGGSSEGDYLSQTASAPAVLMPFAGDMAVPPPPPPQCAVDGGIIYTSSSEPHGAQLSPPPANTLMAHAFRARRAAATSAVATKYTSAPRALFADPVEDLAAKAQAALHAGPPRTWTGLQHNEDDELMQMDG